MCGDAALPATTFQTCPGWQSTKMMLQLHLSCDSHTPTVFLTHHAAPIVSIHATAGPVVIRFTRGRGPARACHAPKPRRTLEMLSWRAPGPQGIISAAPRAAGLKLLDVAGTTLAVAAISCHLALAVAQGPAWAVAAATSQLVLAVATRWQQLLQRK